MEQRKTKIKVILFKLIFLLISFLALANFARAESSVESAIELEENARLLGLNWRKESIQQSVILLLKAVEIWRKLGNKAKTSDCLRKIGQYKLILGEKDSAKIFFLSGLSEIENTNLAAEKAKLLSELSLYYLYDGNTDQSLTTYRKALELSDKSNDLIAKAEANFCGGEYFYATNNLPKSTSSLERAVYFFKQANDFQGEARSKLSLGYTYLKDNIFDSAMLSFKESQLISLQISDVRGNAFALKAIGRTFTSFSENRKAFEALKQAEIIFPDDLDFAEKAALLNAISQTYELFGEYNLTFSYRKKALELFVKEKHSYGQLGTIFDIVELSAITRDFESCDEYLIKGENLAKILKDDFNLARNYEQSGNCNAAKAEYQKALENYQVALLLFQKNKATAQTFRVKNEVGKVLLLNNNLFVAKKLLNESLAYSEKTSDISIQADTLLNIAKIEQLENNLAAALKLTNQSIKLTELFYSETDNSNLKRSYFSNVFERYELLIHLLMQKHKQSPSEDFAIQALQAAEKSRSRSLLETLRLSEADFTKDANPQTVQKEKEIRNLLSLKTTKLTKLLSSDALKSEIDKVDDERRTLDHELETIKAEFKQNSPIYSAIKNPPPFDVAEFQQNILDEKTVLLEFALGEKESYLWLITKNEVSSYILPARDIIENRIDKLHETFEAKQSLSVDSPEVYLQKNEELDNFFAVESKLLSNDLLGQVVDKLTDKRLIIVPDGKLSLLPISALPSPNSDELMIVSNEIVYEPSASLLKILPKIQINKHLPTKDLLVFADPVFSNTDIRFKQNTEIKNNISEVLGLNLRDFRIVDSNGVIKRLPASQKEAESIAETVGSSRTEIASGFGANRERVIQSNISDYRMLHFATHGLIDVKRPEVSSIVLSTLDENGNNIEGYLRLQDIYSLNLASDLVVLSACESGVGKEVKGEGLMSMNNAFLQAGAKSVVSSAWKVDDNATAQMMSSFYSNLIDKRLTPSEALRQAQIKMSKSTQYKSPFFWAAFTVQGEFKQSISLSTNYFDYVLFGILGIVGLILVWRVSKLKNYWTTKE